MLKIKKIIKTLIHFLMIILLLCFSISIIKVWIGDIEPTEILDKTGLYFLYIIGYGALEGDAFLQNILALIGIVSLALLSTFLTINLFWRLDDVKLDPVIHIDLANQIITFIFTNKGQTICDLKANFQLYDSKFQTSSQCDKDYTIPLVLKNGKWVLQVSLKETFWYQTIYELLTSKTKELYCLYSFADTNNGQSSIRVEKILLENLYDSNLATLTKETFLQPIILSTKKLQTAANQGKISLENDKYIYQLKRNASGFVMAYINFHQEIFNLERLSITNASFTFQAKSLKPLMLTLEIKNNQGVFYSKVFELSSKNQTFEISLAEWTKLSPVITEICFTVFKENNDMQNEFSLSNIKIYHKE